MIDLFFFTEAVEVGDDELGDFLMRMSGELGGGSLANEGFGSDEGLAKIGEGGFGLSFDEEGEGFESKGGGSGVRCW